MIPSQLLFLWGSIDGSSSLLSLHQTSPQIIMSHPFILSFLHIYLLISIPLCSIFIFVMIVIFSSFKYVMSSDKVSNIVPSFYPFSIPFFFPSYQNLPLFFLAFIPLPIASLSSSFSSLYSYSG